MQPRPSSPQSSLFDDNTDPAATSAATSLARALVDGNGPKAQNRWQREFGKLSAGVTTLRRALEEAVHLRDAYQAHVAKVFEPRWRELLAVRREWVIAADGVLQGQAALPKALRLSGRRRKHMAAFIVEQVVDLLAQGNGDDDELTAIHDRHNEITLDESRELDEAMTKSMLEDLVGPEIAQGHDAKDIESMIHRAREHLEAQSRAQEKRRQASRGGAKARAKREQAAKEVSQSVREVYRKLASALHPDRETDHAERERKTELMQKANQAYEKGDLLALLTMQISLIETDQGALARADDKRLQLYCQALREQQQALQQEIADVEAPIRDALDLAPGQVLPGREALFARVDRDAKKVKRGIEGARQDMAALLDPKRCGALVDLMPVAEFDEEELRMLEAAMADVGGPRRRRRRR